MWYKISYNLHQTLNGSVKRATTFEGNDLFGLIDSISLQTRIDLGISENIINLFPDLPVKEHTTKNLNAYRYFIYGGYFNKDFSTGSSTLNFKKAVDRDSTVALASYQFAWHSHFYLSSKICANKYISLAMRHRKRLPEYRDIQVRILNYSILGENEKAIALSEMQHKLQPYNTEILLTLIDIYIVNFLNDKAKDAIKQLNKIVPDYPPYQIMLARSYLISNKVDEGLKYLEKRIEENPDNAEFLIIKGQFLLHKGDLENAEMTFRKAMLLSPEDEKRIMLMLEHIRFARNELFKDDHLPIFTGKYRSNTSEYFFNIIIHNDHLFRKEVNQWGFFQYRLSDTSFTGMEDNIFHNTRYCINRRGKVYKLIDLQSDLNASKTYWHQDSLILRGEKLPELNKQKEALIAFQSAYSDNSEHCYLANYIRHLEFVQGQEHEEIIPVLESLVRRFKYSSSFVEVYRKGSQLFINDPSGLDFEVLPLSENQFINPSYYEYITQSLGDDHPIKGFNVIFASGNKFVFERVSA